MNPLRRTRAPRHQRPDEPVILCGIQTYIDYTQWHIGASFWTPAFSPAWLITDLKRAWKYKPFDWVAAQEKQNGVMGVRVWRVR